MKKNLENHSEKGFSLIELLLVVVIVGIISAIATQLLFRARNSAENRAAIAHLNFMRSSQAAYLARAGRYARLDELSASQNGNLGTANGDGTIRRGKFTYTLDPATTTDDALRTAYTVIATRDNDSLFPTIYLLDQSGYIDGSD